MLITIANFHADCDCDGNGNCDSYCYGYCHSHTNGNSDSHSNGNGHFYPQTLSDSKRCPVTKASANSAASPVVGGDWREISQGREAPMQGVAVC